MNATLTASEGFGLLIAQGLAAAPECLDAMAAVDAAVDGARRAAAALALAGLARSLALRRGEAAQRARRQVWDLAQAGAPRPALIAAARDPEGLLRPAESEAIAREVVGWLLRRGSTRYGR